MFQGTPQFGLEDDGQSDEDDRHALLQKPVDDMQVKGAADDRNDTQKCQPLDKGNGARIAEK